MRNHENANTLFPVFLKPDKLKILIVGGGNVAFEKLHFLLKSSPGANITVVAPEISPVLTELAERHTRTRIVVEAWREDLIGAYDIVIAATDDCALNKRIRREARNKKALVNVPDTPDLCDFYMGAIVTKGNLKLAISTNGKSPTFAKRFRALLEHILPDELPETLNDLHKLRASLKIEFSEKVKKLNKITSGLAVHFEDDKPSGIEREDNFE